MNDESGFARVGFIGLGNMGAPMAKRLLDWPGGLTVCDVRAEAVQPFVDAGARSASTPAEVAEHSIVICVTVIDDAQVREVLTGADGVLVDAPVSGGAPGATQGALAVMVGGSEAALDRIRAPFGSFSDLIVHAGEVGAGTRMKLARNLLHFVAFTAATEAQRLAAAAGLDIAELGRVVRGWDTRNQRRPPALSSCAA